MTTNVAVSVKSSESSLGWWVSKVTGYFGTAAGSEKMLQIFQNCFDWSAHLHANPKDAEWHRSASAELTRVTSFYPFLDTISSLIHLRERWYLFWNTDGPEAVPLMKESVLLVGSVAEAACSLDLYGAVSLGVWSTTAKIVSQVALCVLAPLEFILLSREKASLEGRVKAVSPGLASVHREREYRLYLSVVRVVSYLMLAVISLIELIAPAMAYGFLFAPGVNLALTTVYLVAYVTHHFWGECLNAKEQVLRKEV